MQRTILTVIVGLCLAVFTVPAHAGNTIHVPADYPTIQQAIDAAHLYDTIMVAPGTYNETVTVNKIIYLVSSGGPAVTTIDAQGNGSVITVLVTGGTSTIEGFTITGGSAPLGGGIRNEAAHIIVNDCILKNNLAQYHGGGMYNDQYSSSTVTNCILMNNSAPHNGGGMYNHFGTNVTVSQCNFRNNSATYGGGIMNNIESNLSVMDSVFENNSAQHNGGGMYIHNGVNASVTNCVFRTNLAQNTGAAMANATLSNVGIGDSLFCENTPVTIHGSWTDLGGNEFVDECPQVELHVPSDYATIQQAINAAFDGYAVIVAPGTYNENVTVNKALDLIGSGGPDVTIIDAQGSGRVITVPSSGAGSTIEGVTITGGNAGLGAGMSISGETNVAVINCVFENNFASIWGGGLFNDFASTVTVTGCIFRNNSSDWQGGGMFIGETSTASISGSIFCENTPDDIDGPFDDFGGNEFPDVCPPECDLADLNCDGIVDGADLLILLSQWGECADPDDCPADLNEDGVVDGADLLILLANWG